MEVILNNTPVQLSSNGSLFQLMEQAQLETKKGIAVAVNNAVIPRTEWPNLKLNNNDKITVIKATQGG